VKRLTLGRLQLVGGVNPIPSGASSELPMDPTHFIELTHLYLQGPIKGGGLSK
jgi:hypothetical protein